MQSVIDRLCDENIGENGGLYSQDSDYVKIARIKSEKLDKLIAGFSDSQKELYEAVSDCDCEIEGIINTQKTHNAFCLGALIMMEVMDARENYQY